MQQSTIIGTVLVILLILPGFTQAAFSGPVLEPGSAVIGEVGAEQVIPVYLRNFDESGNKIGFTDGFAGFNIISSFDEPGIVTVSAVELKSNLNDFGVKPAVPSEAVRISGLDLGQQIGSETTDLLLCSLTLKGLTEGATTLGFEIREITDGKGNSIPATVVPAQITVGTVPPPEPEAAFSGTPLSGAPPLAVTFTDASTGSPVNWSWTFGDNSTSTLQNPSHTYSAVGTYTVNLTAGFADGTYDSEEKTDYISVCSDTPKAAFSGTPRSGVPPLAVTFTDASTGSPVNWSWTFGDNSTSTLQNPSHTYASEGTYTVNLTAGFADGTYDSEEKTDYISVCSVTQEVAFSGTPRSGVSPLLVTFTDASTGSLVNWSWTFGDEGTSTLQNPSHTYSAIGTYTVNLTAGYADGTYESEEKENYISVTEIPPTPQQAVFSGSPTTGPAPLMVTFIDESTGSPTSWIWSFGDGTSSRIENPLHQYSDVGTYTVWLRAEYSDGTSSSLEREDYIAVQSAPTPTPTPTPTLTPTPTPTPEPLQALFTAEPLDGQPPLSVAFTDTSTGIPTSWEWNFGDGSYSYEQNPIHTYGGIGLFSVTLKVAKDGANAVTRKPSLIAVTAQEQNGYGVLIISSNPTGATVYISGVERGTTPLTIEKLVPGPYTVRLTKEGYQDYSEGAYVRNAIPTVLSPELTSVAGAPEVQGTMEITKELPVF